MHKWICLGVIGGLLEFGVVYQIAFSEPGSSAPQTPRVAETDSTSRPPKANRTTQRPARHLTTAAGTAGVHNLATAPDPGTVEKVPADSPPATAGVPTFPVENISLSSAEVTTALTQSEDLLTATLIAAASVVAAVPAVLDQLTGAAPPGEIPGLPVDLSPILPKEPVAAPVAPPPTPEAAPEPPVELASMPIEEMIREVFGEQGDKAVQVAFCESTMRTHAKRGQYLGLFQMGANERADYGHGSDALAQILAAYALYQDRGWQPWACA